MAEEQQFHNRGDGKGLDEVAEAFFRMDQRRREAEGGGGAAPPSDPAPQADPPGAPPVAAEPETPDVAPAPAEDGAGAEQSAPPDETGAGDPPAEVELDPQTPILLGDGTQVTLHELQRGFLRERDYTQKTQDLAAQRRELEVASEQQVQALGQERERLSQLIERLEPLAQVSPQEAAELENLRHTNTAEWSARMHELQLRRQAVGAAKQEEQRLRQQELLHVVIPRERAALAEKLPAFRDDFDGNYERLGRYLTSPDGGGLRPEEWDSVTDHRQIALAWKAMQYDLATRRGALKPAKKLARLPKVRPGAHNELPQSGDTERKEYQAALGRVQEGGLDDLAAAFLAKTKMNRATRGRRAPG